MSDTQNARKPDHVGTRPTTLPAPRRADDAAARLFALRCTPEEQHAIHAALTATRSPSTGAVEHHALLDHRTAEILRRLLAAYDDLAANPPRPAA